MDERIFNIILLLIPILGAIITGYIIPFIKAKVGEQNLATITKWIGYAVKAAEMIFREEKQGVEKKEYVVNFINKLFNKTKVVITREQIEVLIEAAVKEMNDSKVHSN